MTSTRHRGIVSFAAVVLTADGLNRARRTVDVVLRVRSFLLDLNTVADGTRAVVFCHDALVLTFRYVCEGPGCTPYTGAER